MSTGPGGAGRGGPLRLLIIDDSHGLWGAQNYLLRLAPLLAERGIDQVLATPPGAACATAWRSIGLQHVPIEVSAQRSIRAGGRISVLASAREAGRSASQARRIARLCRSVGADLVQANAHWTHLDTALAGRVGRFPTLLLLHEQNLAGAASLLRGAAVSLASSSVAVSQAVADGLPARLRGRVAVVRNGVDTDTFRPDQADSPLRAGIAANPACPVVLVLSRLDRHKNIDQVIEAVAATPPELEVQLAIAGEASLDPDWPEQLRALAARRLGPRARFLGHRDDVAALLHSADVFVLASDVEGLPLSILEAQACGLPVVAVPSAGVPEVVSDGRTGLLVPAGDTAALTRAVSRVLGEPALAQQLAGAARDAVVANHQLARQADELAEVMHRTWREHRRGC